MDNPRIVLAGTCTVIVLLSLGAVYNTWRGGGLAPLVCPHHVSEQQHAAALYAARAAAATAARAAAPCAQPVAPAPAPDEASHAGDRPRVTAYHTLPKQNRTTYPKLVRARRGVRGVGVPLPGAWLAADQFAS